MTRSAGEGLRMPAPNSGHLPVRPTWECSACEAPWPCHDARQELHAQYDRHPSGLAIYMASTMYDAVDDLTRQRGSTPGNLYERFLSWV
jgi:hypothetical protein